MAHDALDYWNFGVACVGLATAIGGTCFAVYTLRRGNRNASASLVYGMQVGFMQAFDSYLTETDGDRLVLKMNNIMTLVEVSAAIHCDDALAGKSGDVMKEYLRDILTMIAGRDDLVEMVREMRHAPNVFIYLDKFIDSMAAKGLAGGFLALRRPIEPADPHSEFHYVRHGGRVRTAWVNFQREDFPGFAPLLLERWRRGRKGAAPVRHGMNDR